VLGAVARDSTWNYLATLSDEVAECTWVFVVDGYLFIGTKAAYLPPLKRSFLPRPAWAL